jgi:hypothetical protein
MKRKDHMALLTVQQISGLAVELLSRSIVLPNVVSRVPGSDYQGSGGTTLVAVPQPLTAREQATGGSAITYDSPSETSVPVNLSHWYSGVQLTDEQLTLELRDFGKQVLNPMVQAIAEAGENCIADVLNGLTATQSFAATASADDTRDVILAAREALVENDVPVGNRHLVVSPQIATRMFQVDGFVRADATGDSSALRNATLGSIFGLTVSESNALDAGTAVAMHSSAIAFATLAPAIPAGAAAASASQAEGVALRVVRDFDPGHLSDVVVASTFGGASLVDADRIVKIDTGA